MSCLTIPIVKFNDCFPLINFSEIEYIYVAETDAVDFTDWHDINEWNQRISNDGTIPDGSPFATKDLLRKLTVTADMPLPSSSYRLISGGRNAEIKTPRVINIDIDETTSENYDFTRSTETMLGAKVKLWFKTTAGVRWGGNSGITGILKLRPVLGRGGDSIELYTGTFAWDDIVSPNRYQDISTTGEVSGETGSSNDSTNQKERIEFGTESTKSVEWNTTREGKFGISPTFQVWQYRVGTSGPADEIEIPVYTDAGSPENFIFYLPGTAGYIIIS